MTRAARNLIIAALTAGSVWGCAAQPPAESETKSAKRSYTVSGRVVRDSRTKDLEAPVVTMMEVVVNNAPASGPGAAGFFESELTPDQSFRFDSVPPGRYIARLIPAPVGTNPVTIVVGRENVTGVEIAVPLTVTVSGKIDIADNGLTPRFTLICGNSSVSTNGVPHFTLEIREGEHRVSLAGLPKGYTVQSLTYGSVDLLADPLKIAANEPLHEIVVKLGVSSPPPWVRVRGRVTRGGQPAGVGAGTRIALLGISVKDRSETAVRPDGSFEFPRVLPGKYHARLIPEIAGMDPVGITIDRENVEDWKIPLPRPEIRVRVVVADGGAPPNFQLIFYDVPLSSAAPTETNNRAIPLKADATFTTSLPAGEYARIEPHGLPRGYTVKSFTDGSTDLLKQPLKVDGRSSKQLVLTLVKAP